MNFSGVAIHVLIDSPTDEMDDDHEMDHTFMGGGNHSQG